jgi:hypothetical protein
VKFYKQYESFLKNDSHIVAAPNFSIKNSMTGNFFYNAFRKVRYVYRMRSLNDLGLEIDAILDRLYNEYSSTETEEETTEPGASASSDAAPALLIGSGEPDEPVTIDADYQLITQDAERYNKELKEYNAKEKAAKALPNNLPSGPTDTAFQFDYQPYFDEAKALRVEADKIRDAAHLEAFRKQVSQLNDKIWKQYMMVCDVLADGSVPDEHMDKVLDCKEDVKLSLNVLLEIAKRLKRYSKPRYAYRDGQHVEVPNGNFVKESVSQLDIIITPVNWSPEKMKEITSKLNMYELEEMYLKAKFTVDDNNRPKDKPRLEHHWSIILNKIYRKWNYVYDIKQIKSKNIEQYTKKEKPLRVEAYKAATVIGSTLSSGAKVFRSPDFKGADKSTADFYLLTFGTHKMVFMRKVRFEDDMLFFKMIGEVSANTDGVLSIPTKYKGVREFVYQTQSVPLHLDKDDYPVVLVKDDKMLSTKPNNHTRYIKTDGCNLVAITDAAVIKQIEKSSNMDLSGITNTLEDTVVTELKKQYK